MERVGGKVDVGAVGSFACGADGAVASGVAALVGDEVAIGNGDGVAAGGDVDGGDVERCKGAEFSGFAETILVEIAPDAQVGKGTIGRRDLAVCVAVELGECGETISGNAATG